MGVGETGVGEMALMVPRMMRSVIFFGDKAASIVTHNLWTFNSQRVFAQCTYFYFAAVSVCLIRCKQKYELWLFDFVARGGQCPPRKIFWFQTLWDRFWCRLGWTCALYLCTHNTHYTHHRWVGVSILYEICPEFGNTAPLPVTPLCTRTTQSDETRSAWFIATGYCLIADSDAAINL